MNQGEGRRQDDIVLAELCIQFKDFLDRYERDWRHTKEWRDAHWRIMDEHSKLLNEIAPNYRRGILVISTIFVGAIAFVVKAILSHFKWS